MNHYVEPFFLVWGLEVAGDQIEFSVGCCEVMLATLVSEVQPGSAGFVFDVDEVKAVRGLGGVSQTA